MAANGIVSYRGPKVCCLEPRDARSDIGEAHLLVIALVRLAFTQWLAFGAGAADAYSLIESFLIGREVCTTFFVSQRRLGFLAGSH